MWSTQLFYVLAWLASAADALHVHLDELGEKKVEHSSSPWNLTLVYIGGGEVALYPPTPLSALLGVSVCVGVLIQRNLRQLQ